MNRAVFLDCNSTTPVDPRIVDAMLPYFTESFGNAASLTHRFGMQAREAVELARTQIAAFINAEPREIVFTSGATESINIALLGAARSLGKRGNRIITCQTEHKAVLDTCGTLESEGFEVIRLGVNSEGGVDLKELGYALNEKTIVVSFMHANNEIGTIHPVAEIGARVAHTGALFHVDAAQTYGKLLLNVKAAGIHMMSISAHKIYGPKGVGALYVRRGTRLTPIIHGGGHERGLRPGTLNVPGIVGLATATQIAASEMQQDAARVGELRDLLLRTLQTELNGVQVNGGMKDRLYNNLNLSFGDVEGESLIMSLQDMAVSSGSACTSAAKTPSHVLAALGRTPTQIHSSLRFGLGRFTTPEEVVYAADRIVEAVKKLRSMSPDFEE